MRWAALTTAALAMLIVSACSSNSSSSSSSTPSGGSSPSSSSTSSSLSGTLNASGSTFQTNFQQAAISAFKSVDSGITVNYGGGGSGKGRTDLAGGVVNFPGSDPPIPTTETANFKGKTVLYFPGTIDPTTLAYNLPGVRSLRPTPTV